MAMSAFYVSLTNNSGRWNFFLVKSRQRKKSRYNNWNCFKDLYFQHKKTGTLSGFFMLKTPIFLIFKTTPKHHIIR